MNKHAINNLSSRRQIKIVSIHLAIWVVYAMFNYLINYIQYLGDTYIEDILTKFFIAAFIFYSNVILALPLFYKKRRFVLFGISLVILLWLSFFLKEAIFYCFELWVDYPPSPYSMSQSFIMNTWWWFQYTLFAFGFWFAKELIMKEREKALLEKEKLQAEYSYLKAQVNPHFVINVLNFFYSHSLEVSQVLSDGILYLANFLRYSITNIEDESGKIPLQSEIDQIQNFININQLRFSNNLNVIFEKSGRLSGIKVIPFVFITLIENAFKHGRLIENDEPIIIKLSHDQKSNSLYFLVRNRKEAKNNFDRSDGIGLSNIKNRLSLAYGKGYHLEIKDDPLFFTVNLSIKL